LDCSSIGVDVRYGHHGNGPRRFLQSLPIQEDSPTVYLSVNQGVTTARQLYRRNPKRALQSHASDLVKRLGYLPRPFIPGKITLEVSNQSSLGADYESGNICSCRYASGKIPGSDILLGHLNQLLDVYRSSVDQELTVSKPVDPEEKAHFEDPGKLRLHKRIERNRS
jgi:5-methylcytosine-specific restriction protein A